MGGYPDFKGFFSYTMSVIHLNELKLINVGTNRVSIRVQDDKVYFEMLDKGNPNSLFFALDKKDWIKVKKYIDDNLPDKTINIPTPTNEIQIS